MGPECAPPSPYPWPSPSPRCSPWAAALSPASSERRRRARRHHAAAGLSDLGLCRRRAERSPDGGGARRDRVRRLADQEGKVYAVVNRDGRHRVHVLASGLNQPSGVAFRDGSLYVAAVSRILKFRDVARDLERPPKPEVVSDAYPSDAHHGWKFIAFGPDGRLYVPVGAPCNVCLPPGPLHTTITRLDLAGGRPEVVARGVRNSVGVRLPAGNRRALVYRQRPRLARRRSATRRAESSDPRGRALRLPLLSRRRPARSRAQRRTRLLGVLAAGPAPRPARRGARHALLHRPDVPRALSGRHLHRRARLLEPVDADRLPRHVRPGRGRARDLATSRSRPDG